MFEMAPNEFGVAESVHRTGLIDRSNPFFLELGVNGCTCASCHDGRAGWTITPTFAQQLFNTSDGLAALFRIHDAGSRPDADISTREARRKGLSHQIGVTASFTRMRWTLTHSAGLGMRVRCG